MPSKKPQAIIRLPDDAMLDKIDTRAKKVGLSRNAWMVKALSWALEQPVTDRPAPKEKV